jgi:hypothetical protein
MSGLPEPSGHPELRPELKACHAFLDAGDTLAVPSLDRYGRSLQDDRQTAALLHVAREDRGLGLIIGSYLDLEILVVPWECATPGRRKGTAGQDAGLGEPVQAVVENGLALLGVRSPTDVASTSFS